MPSQILLKSMLKKKMEKIPDVVFILNLEKNNLALLEAVRVKRTIIALADTNVDPSEVHYMIPANDDTVSSVSYVLEKITKSMQ